MRLVSSLLVVALATPLVVADPRSNPLRRQLGNDDKDSSFSSLPTKDLTASSAASAKDQSSITLVGTAPLGIGIPSAPETTQAVVVTDVVYTTLTTCPVTSLVTSGSISFEEVTTTISTVTRTSTSTVCTKCVAPPSHPAVSPSSPPTSPGESASSLLLSLSIYPSSQPSLSLLSISTSAAVGSFGTGGLSSIRLTNTIPVIPLQTSLSSKPEVPSTAISPSRSLVFPSPVSLTVLTTSGVASTPSFPGYGIVPSPTSTPGSPKEEIHSNATSSIIPVYTAALLGNAYGGGFVGTPSIFVTKLPYPNGPSSGVPPGYESESSIPIVENNLTAVFTGLQASSTSTASLQSATEIGIPALSATSASNISAQIGSLIALTISPTSPSTSSASLQSTTNIEVPASSAAIASNVSSALIGSLGASSISSTASGNEASTPTFISLSPFGGKVSQEFFSSTAVPNGVSVPGSPSSAVGGGLALSTAVSVLINSPESNGANIITAVIPATSPVGALSVEVSQVSNAVLSSLAAAGFSTSPVSVQVAVVGSSTSSVIGLSSETVESSSPTPTLIGGAVIPPLVITMSPLGGSSSLQATAVIAPLVIAMSPLGGSSILQATTTAESAGGLATSPVGLAGVIEASVIPPPTDVGVPLSSTISESGVIIEASPAGSPTPGEIGATIIPSLSAEQSAGPVVTLAVGSSAEQNSAAGQAVASIPAPITIANGNTALAVVPSPVVGANGLTSLAIFSTPIAPAAGLNNPAVLLTPIVGNNGLTSLAVVATPVVGANGLTSLAIGFETETTPATSQSNSAPSPVEGFVIVPSPVLAPQVSGIFPIQTNIGASGVANVALPSGSVGSPVSGGSENGNYSIHVLLNPTAATQFQGSAVRISVGFGLGLLGLFMFLALL